MNVLSKMRNFSRKHLAGHSEDYTLSAPEKAPVSETVVRAASGGLVGGVIGTLAGAGIGALVGRSRAIDAYESSTETSSVELSWQSPVMERQNIGYIPKDERINPSIWNELGWNKKPTRVNPDTEAVYRDNPRLDASGSPVMQDHTKVFEGYGEPKVSWATSRIINREVSGYDRDVTSRLTGQWGCHRNWGGPDEDERVEQWCVDYDPKIRKTEVGTYEHPNVKFERPEAENAKISSATLRTAAKGAGIGLVTGLAVGVLGSLLTKSMDSEVYYR